MFEFSRSHCVAICATLVPANLLVTSQTMLWVWLRRPLAQVQLTAGVAGCYALLLLLHVFTWFAIGVVMAPTFILMFLGSLCLAINLSAVLYSRRRGGYGRDGYGQDSHREPEDRQPVASMARLAIRQSFSQPAK
ncbi:MAG: hypothetical protein KME07_23910 [Pegethrix bostrychoides GSE-TBD4-15B]|uniref:Uncharacterized protein n=1 Tax=Pegethrix bostrychoides GSE-TBD4-15B TaxID=2839662 RepID=A0A951PGG2_9CYAN|nr:hypothetical protein [Pegethrix bostrychoides GSE-TBD4-15B]